jgi:hypothetical protein
VSCKDTLNLMTTNVGKLRTYIILKMIVFWVVAPHSLVEVYQCLIGVCCLHQQGYYLNKYIFLHMSLL